MAVVKRHPPPSTELAERQRVSRAGTIEEIAKTVFKCSARLQNMEWQRFHTSLPASLK